MKANKILFASILSCLVLSSLTGCGKKYDDYVNEDYVGQGIISSDVDSTAASNSSTNCSYEITKQLSYSAAVDSDIISAVKNKDEQLFVLDTNNDNVSIDMSTDNHIIGLVSQSNKSKDSKAKVVLKTDADGNILMLDNDGNVVSLKRSLFYSMYVPTIMADNTEDTTEEATENSNTLITKEEDITGKFIIDIDKTVVTIDNNTYVEDIPMNIDTKTTSSDDIVVAIIDSIKNTESNYVTNYNSSLSETINNLANEVVDSSDPRVVNVTVNDDGSKTLEVVISTDVLVIEDDGVKVDTVETTVVITVPADNTTSKTTESKSSTDNSEKTTDESKTTSNEETTRPTESSSTSEVKTDESKFVETEEVETDDSTPATEHKSYYEDLPDQEAPEREYEAGEEVDWEKSDPNYTQEKILPDGDPYTVEE